MSHIGEKQTCPLMDLFDLALIVGHVGNGDDPVAPPLDGRRAFYRFRHVVDDDDRHDDAVDCTRDSDVCAS